MKKEILLPAINKKYQSKVNWAIKYLIQYSQLVDQINKADGNEDVKTVEKLEKLSAKIFDKYLDIVTELPKREMENIEKSKYY